MMKFLKTFNELSDTFTAKPLTFEDTKLLISTDISLNSSWKCKYYIDVGRNFCILLTGGKFTNSILYEIDTDSGEILQRCSVQEFHFGTEESKQEMFENNRKFSEIQKRYGF